MMTFNFIGWVRDGTPQGNIKRYTLKHISNAITTFAGGISKDPETGMYKTTPYVLIEYGI